MVGAAAGEVIAVLTAAHAVGVVVTSQVMGEFIIGQVLIGQVLCEVRGSNSRGRGRRSLRGWGRRRSSYERGPQQPRCRLARNRSFKQWTVCGC